MYFCEYECERVFVCLSVCIYVCLSVSMCVTSISLFDHLSLSLSLSLSLPSFGVITMRKSQPAHVYVAVIGVRVASTKEAVTASPSETRRHDQHQHSTATLLPAFHTCTVAASCVQPSQQFCC